MLLSMKSLFLLGMLLLALPSAAMTVPLSSSQIAERSDAIVEARVVAAESVWVGSRIVTFYKMQRMEVWKDKGETSIDAVFVVGVPGGAVDSWEQKVVGAPMLLQDKRYLLCLGGPEGPRNARIVVGWRQGVWQIDESSPATVVSSRRAGLDALMQAP